MFSIKGEDESVRETRVRVEQRRSRKMAKRGRLSISVLDDVCDCDETFSCANVSRANDSQRPDWQDYRRDVQHVIGVLNLEGLPFGLIVVVFRQRAYL